MTSILCWTPITSHVTPAPAGLARRGSKRIIHIISPLHDVSHVGGGRVCPSPSRDGQIVRTFLRDFGRFARPLLTRRLGPRHCLLGLHRDGRPQRIRRRRQTLPHSPRRRSPRGSSSLGSSSMGRLHEPHRGNQGLAPVRSNQVACFATFCPVSGSLRGLSLHFPR